MQEVHVFSSERESIVGIFRAIIKDIPASNELAIRFVKTKKTSQFRTSFLGIFWLIIPPFVSTVVWVYLNSTLNLNLDTKGVPYPLFVFVSSSLWGVFVDALTSTRGWYTSNFSVMSKVNIPMESIVIAAFYELLFNSIIRTGILIVMISFLKPELLYFFHYYLFSLFSTLIFGFSIGLFLVPISILVADVFNIINMALPVLMLITPILYPVKTDGFSSYVNILNPLTAIIDTPRAWFLGNEAHFVSHFWIYFSLSFVLLLLGFILQRIALPHLVVKMS